MSLTLSSMMSLGTPAPDFKLPDVISGKVISLSEARGAKGTVIMFICAHCPYVIHIQEEIVNIAHYYQDQGIDFVAISSNDAIKYPGDSPEALREQATSVGFTFPYLYDESQSVARAYKAECTPDFFVFDENNLCVYRGRMDEASPGNGKPVNGKDLREALEALVLGTSISDEQHPSMGCNIKWK